MNAHAPTGQGPAIPVASTARGVQISVPRVALLGSTVVYLLVYVYSYRTFTTVAWDYFGMGWNTYWSLDDIVFFTILALLPAFWVPASARRPSDLFLLLQYFLIYIPTLFLTQHASIGTLQPEQRVSFSLTLAFGMMIMIVIQRALPRLRIPRPDIPGPVMWTGIVIALFASLLFLWTILGKFEIVALADIYSVRDRVTEILELRGGRFGGYSFSWANAVLLPLLVAYTLMRRRWLLAVIVLGGYVVLFGLWGAKASLFAPVYLVLFYVLFGNRPSAVPSLMCLGFCALLLVPVLFGDPKIVSAIRIAYVGVVNMRVFAMPSLALVEYMDFFQRHALTYGSHITGLSLLVDYPYDLDVPRTVGYHYYGALMTANVSFWAQDGLASLGLVGIPVVSVLVALTLWLLDSVSAHLPMRFIATAMGGIAIGFLGTSLFTTLLTGGLLLMMMFFWVLRAPERTGTHTVGASSC